MNEIRGWINIGGKRIPLLKGEDRKSKEKDHYITAAKEKDGSYKVQNVNGDSGDRDAKTEERFKKGEKIEKKEK